MHEQAYADPVFGEVIVHHHETRADAPIIEHDLWERQYDPAKLIRNIAIAVGAIGLAKEAAGRDGKDFAIVSTTAFVVSALTRRFDKN